MSVVFTELEIAYLRSQRLGRLATVQPNGQPQASPVRFSWKPQLGVIDIAGLRMKKTQKFRNLATNNLVAFVVDDVPSLDPYQVRCLEIRGIGEALVEPTDGLPFGDGSVLRIHPKRVISWGIDPDAVSPRDVG